MLSWLLIVVFEKNIVIVFLKTTQDNFGQHINGISVKLLSPANAVNNHSNVVLVVKVVFYKTIIFVL